MVIVSCSVHNYCNTTPALGGAQGSNPKPEQIAMSRGFSRPARIGISLKFQT
jgi:hypothetical protein